MPDFLTLTCPTCGAKLKLNEKVHLLVCASCGNEHMVHRDGGAIYLAPMAQDVRQIRVSTDKTAAELAIPRLVKEIQGIEEEFKTLQAETYIHQVKASPLENRLSLGMVATLVLAGITAILSYTWITIAMVLALIVLTVFYGGESRKRSKEADRLKEVALTRVQAKHVEKSKALARNHEIANS